MLEQIEIAKLIKNKVSKIDAQISKAHRRIELLNELKQSIITEAVTGKIKVI
jgi:type I restriction enzyme S subunit